MSWRKFDAIVLLAFRSLLFEGSKQHVMYRTRGNNNVPCTVFLARESWDYVA
jgi:hypothetical protein